MELPDRATRGRITYRVDLVRSAFHAILFEGTLAFGLLVAIRYFEAPAFGKGLVSAAFSIGLLASPIGLYLIRQTGLEVSRAGSLLLIIGAGGVVIAAGANAFWVFAAGLLFASMLFAQLPQLVVQMYSNNFTPSERGARLSHFIFTGAASAGLFSWLAGDALDHDISSFRWVFVVIAVAAVCSGLLLRMIPTLPLSHKNSGNPWQNLRLAWDDKLFGLLLTGWMIMGIGNLLTIPLRYEYLANPLYNLNLPNAQIAIILVLVPSVFRIIGAMIWGQLFDRINFITVRVCLNLLIMSGILLFFFSKTLPFLILASVFTGLALGGANIAWTLWVTKVAPEEKVPAYMSVHTGTTGFRGVLAPFLGYFILTEVGPTNASLISASLIIISTFLFLSLWKNPRFTKKGEAIGPS